MVSVCGSDRRGDSFFRVSVGGAGGLIKCRQVFLCTCLFVFFVFDYGA